MRSIEIKRAMTENDIAVVVEFLDLIARADGRRPLSDHLHLDLVNGGLDGFAAFLVSDSDELVAYAQLSRGNDESAFELVIHPDHRDDTAAIGSELIEAAIEVVAGDGGGHVNWWVFEPTAEHTTLAAAAGMAQGRTLYQMRRSLPTDLPVTIVTRDFVPDDDDEAWLKVNNRAFAEHGEQGGWTAATLRQRRRESWFDPAGFRVLDIDGRMAGFCWTKVHPAGTSDEVRLGEIYVIAVDPDFHGRGLGAQLTLAGLDHLAGVGITTAMLYVDGDNTPALALYERLGFRIHSTTAAFTVDVAAPASTTELPRWSVADVHESLESRSFTDAMENVGADVGRLVALFDELGVRDTPDRTVTQADGATADRVLRELNRVTDRADELGVYVYATVATDSRDERAQALLSEIRRLDATLRPLMSRLADWVASLGVDELAALSDEARDHLGPLRRLAARAEHQMTESEEHLAAELTLTGSTSWGRLHADLTSQLTTEVVLPDGPRILSMPAVRGLATDADPAVRRAGYDAELRAWPTVEVPVAVAMNAIKGEAIVLDRRRGWPSPVDASLFANSVGRATFEAMQAAVVSALADLRRWMRAKAELHGHAPARGLPWWDLVAPLPFAAGSISWNDGVEVVRSAFGRYSDALGGLVDRALEEAWIDAEPRDGKTGGAFCARFVGDRSLVLLNWSGSLESTQTTAHELGHAYHNTQLGGRTALQRRLPMALAETASIFCETLVAEAGLARLGGTERLAQLDVDLAGSNQLIVDIHSRFLFEQEVFAHRERRTLSARELCEMMTAAQAEAYGDGLDQSTAHPYMWLLKPHYYGSHFYNWPYTYGLLFGLGLFACYREDPERFRAGYDDLLSRAGMDTAEELGRSFDLDVTDEAFWTAGVDMVRGRIDDYVALAATVAP